MAHQIEHGRAAFADGAWQQAYDLLSAIDEEAPLDAADLDRLAVAAYMLGRLPEHNAACERRHRALLDAGEALPAARAALWLGMHLFGAGEAAQGRAWLGRAQKLVDEVARDCVERGYLLMPLALQREAGGDFAGAAEAAAAAVEYAERFGDPELRALATHVHGHMLVQLGRIDEGRELLDDAMLSVTAGELSPITSGIVYCGVILACQDAFDLGRAREWTAALSRWCDRQPDMVAFTGRCRVHRAEILQREGAWRRALEEASAAGERAARTRNRRAQAEAAYVRGELHRLQGRLADAEAAYREASDLGREPQPGLALLRAAQGDTGAAAGAIRRCLAEAGDRSRRAALLPAAVEVLLLCGDTAAARAAGDELDAIATGQGGDLLPAMAAHAAGAVALVEGDAQAAAPRLREAVERWVALDCPYEAGRTRVLLSLACRALGDQDGAAMELDGAREVFERLGAAEPIEVATPVPAAPGDAGDHGLSARELEVLRLVAAGRTNRAIADELVLSERTVHRHVSNIFAKLRVSSRTAATAYAYEHELV